MAMSSNRILSRLSRQDFALLEPHLEAVDLPVRKPLEARRKRIDQVYFIESGFASVVANGTSKPSIEVGIIGREGMTGLAIVLGSDRAQHATYIQAAGKGTRAWPGLISSVFATFTKPVISVGSSLLPRAFRLWPHLRPRRLPDIAVHRDALAIRPFRLAQSSLRKRRADRQLGWMDKSQRHQLRRHPLRHSILRVRLG
jgi:hypothetical protein